MSQEIILGNKAYKVIFDENSLCGKCAGRYDWGLCNSLYAQLDCSTNNCYFKEITIANTKHKKHAALIKLWADGAKIQRYDRPFRNFRVNRNGGWVDVQTPTFKDSAKYRVKPDFSKEIAELKSLEEAKKNLSRKINDLRNKIGN